MSTSRGKITLTFAHGSQIFEFICGDDADASSGCRLRNVIVDIDRIVILEHIFCLACPTGCNSCSYDDSTCECYEHADQHPRNGT